MSKHFSRENTALKLKGAGDGFKNSIRTSERVPVPSSRKFTATGVRDESVQLKLKKVLDDIEAKQGRLKKARSVAEITPTKSKRKNPSKVKDAKCTTVALHATPRLPPDDAEETPSRRFVEERRLERLVYGRMVLFVWRRSRTRLMMLSESLRRRQDQIFKLENQVDCLKELTQSECDKRNQATGDIQKMEKLVKNVQVENETLQAEKTDLQAELDKLRGSLQGLSIELENMKNDAISKNSYLKRLENEIQKERSLIKYIKEEKISMVNEMRSQEAATRAQADANEKLKETLKTLELLLKNKEASVEMQISELKQTAEQCQLEIKKNESLSTELINQRSISEQMRKKLVSLENELASINECYVHIINENSRLKMELGGKCWWKNAKTFVSITWIVLQNAAYIMLPAM